MTEVEALAFRVLERVSLYGPIQFEDLGSLLLHCTWNQMFAAVDRLARLVGQPAELTLAQSRD